MAQMKSSEKPMMSQLFPVQYVFLNDSVDGWKDTQISVHMLVDLWNGQCKQILPTVNPDWELSTPIAYLDYGLRFKQTLQSIINSVGHVSTTIE